MRGFLVLHPNRSSFLIHKLYSLATTYNLQPTTCNLQPSTAMKLPALVLAIAIIQTIQGQTYFLNGDAQAIGNDCYQLTAATFTQSGTVWYADQINLEEPFNLEFLMNFGGLDAGGADGICFVIQTVGTSAIGISGGGLGYLSFGTSLGIEFDTYQNTESGDLFEDHIAIQINGNIDHASVNNIAGPVAADLNDPNIEDAEDHVVRIAWNPTTQTIDVYFDCVFRLSGTIDLINDVFSGENEVYWGFTAATGGSYNDQTVCLQENILTQTEETTICNGASITLNAGASIDNSYTWSPTTFLDNPQSGAPVCTATNNTTYTVSFNNLCNVPTVLTFDVLVEDLAVSVNTPDIINCINEESAIQANLNLDLDATFTWSINNQVIATGENVDAFNAQTPGSYSVAVDVLGVCTDEQSFEVEADFTEYDVLIEDHPELNCLNETVSLQGNYDGSGASVQWLLNNTPLTGASQNSFVANEPGMYSFITIHPISGCSAQDSTFLTSNFTTPIVTAGDQDSLTCVFPSIPIANIFVESQNDFSVSWTTIDGQLDGNTSSIYAYASAPGTYTITVQDNTSGCTAEASAFVGTAATYDLDLSSLTFPNVISANGDSKNERWQPFLRDYPAADLSSIFEDYNLVIYNRWGQIVFQSKSYNDAFRAKELPESVYYYSLEFNSPCGKGKSGEAQGYIEVLR